MTLADLKAKLDRMSPAKIRFVARLIDELDKARPATVKQHGTWITDSEEWLEHFSLALSVHHGTTSEPLRQTSFEAVFRAACESAHWDVGPALSPTHRFVDLMVDADGKKRWLSLKSTAAQRLSERSVHISKLTEAAWIQDERKPQKRRKRLLRLFGDYVDAVDSIMMLRAFRLKDKVPHRYQLVEIPTSIFESIKTLPLADFQRDAPILECRDGDQVVARVAVDRSDAKITVRSISLEACVVHAEWTR